MDDIENRYVAHLDVMGMSEIVKKGADEAWGILSDLVDVRDKMSSIEIEFIDTKERVKFSELFKLVTFSDTIVIFSKSDSSKELHCMIILLAEIFHKAICKCIPVRIGLARGIFYFNEERSMYAGPALIDAYYTGESTQWLGITLSDTVGELAYNMGIKTGLSNIITKWDVPVKDKTIESFVVNWPAIFSHDFNVPLPIVTEQFYQAFASTFGDFEGLPEKDRKKYINTVDFINEKIKCHQQA